MFLASSCPFRQPKRNKNPKPRKKIAAKLKSDTFFFGPETLGNLAALKFMVQWIEGFAGFVRSDNESCLC